MIRFATKEDGPQIAPLLLVILKDMELPFIDEYGEEKTLAILADAVSEPDYRYGYPRGIVKEIDGRIAGVAYGYTSEDEATIDDQFKKVLLAHGIEDEIDLFTDDETFPDEWYLDSISVSEDFRGHGIGSELLEALPKLAHKANKTRIGLSVDKENPAAKRLYERNGFKDVGEMVISGHLYDHMQKEI
ncbi:MAG: GNAT family N-acetyltransferase [Enterococcus sp.]